MGVEAGAWAYFGKTASRLDASEAALLAALVKAPGALNPYGPHRDRLLARQRWVSQPHGAPGVSQPPGTPGLPGRTPQFRGHGPRPPAFPFEAPHFVNLVLAREKAGEPRVPSGSEPPWTCRLQRRAQAIVHSHQARLLKAGASQAAAVIVANRTREVLALVGSCAYGPRDQGFNNGAAAWRSRVPRSSPFSTAWPWTRGSPPPR